MKRKKEDYFVIGLGVLLVVIVFVIAFITTTDTNQDQQPQVTPIPASPTIRNSPFDPEQKGSYIDINQEDQIKLLDRVNNRQTLSSEDNATKTKILTLIPSGKKSGILYQSKTIIIDYVSTADLFQVEILTINIQQAKDEANVWFREQGFSQDAICNYPVMFYLNSTVSYQLQELNIKFSPVGNSC